MKKFQSFGVIFGIAILLSTAILLKAEPNKDVATVRTKTSKWAIKENLPASKASYIQVPPEEWGEKTDLATVRELLGFEVSLPKSPKAAEAGSPVFWVYKGDSEYVKKNGTAPRPTPPSMSGASALIQYPNGLNIGITIRHPQDPTKNYERHVRENNKEKKEWSEKGYLDGRLWERTKVSSFDGYQMEKGYNFIESLGDVEPKEEFKEPRKAFIVWYDEQNWAEFSAYAPIDVSKEELSEVVDSIY